MKQIEKLQLIEGRFSGEEAKEILRNIFSTKIHFHEMKNFSSKERFGKEDATAKLRIPALKKELEKVDQIIQEAIQNNRHLSISSEIKLTLVEA